MDDDNRRSEVFGPESKRSGVHGFADAGVHRFPSSTIHQSQSPRVNEYTNTGHFGEIAARAIPATESKGVPKIAVKPSYDEPVLAYAAWRCVGTAAGISAREGGPDTLDDNAVRALAEAWADMWCPTVEPDDIAEPFLIARDKMITGTANVWMLAEMEQASAELFEAYERSPRILELALNCKACARLGIQSSPDHAPRFGMSQQHAAVVMNKWLSSKYLDVAAGRRALQSLERKGFIKRVFAGVKRATPDPDRPGETLAAKPAEFVWTGQDALSAANLE